MSVSQAGRIMGILNVTPDSFSDGGQHVEVDLAVNRAAEMIAEGAATIDVGGESTRPGAEPVDAAEEIRRVVPTIEAIADQCRVSGVRISVDTASDETARAAVAAGATMINDVTASLWETAAELGVAWIAMHMQGQPRSMQTDPTYEDVVSDVRRYLAKKAALAKDAGVEEVWVDPGIGFGKTTAHNLALLGNISKFVSDGVPVLVGSSRKRSFGVLAAQSDAKTRHTAGRTVGAPDVPKIDPTGPDDRLEGSLISATWAIIQGAQMIRVHDVAATNAALEGAGVGTVASKEK